jgi:hypothetical protein
MILIQLWKNDEYMANSRQILVKDIDKYQGRHPLRELPMKPNVIIAVCYLNIRDKITKKY